MTQKARKHKWVTDALKAGEMTLSVWPSDDDLTTDKKRENFFGVISRVGSDPRVAKVEEKKGQNIEVIYVFHLNND